MTLDLFRVTLPPLVGANGRSVVLPSTAGVSTVAEGPPTVVPGTGFCILGIAGLGMKVHGAAQEVMSKLGIAEDTCALFHDRSGSRIWIVNRDDVLAVDGELQCALLVRGMGYLPVRESRQEVLDILGWRLPVDIDALPEADPMSTTEAT